MDQSRNMHCRCSKLRLYFGRNSQPRRELLDFWGDFLYACSDFYFFCCGWNRTSVSEIGARNLAESHLSAFQH
ncbi:hypothetical protein Ae706Ps2_6569 [Pseudonocardia sp. Ae706_Ps2]|nr:hypothetical protein Ae706Ps2_6563 [Pseudonocardia sp. Ae706_Ps2]OLM08869.1 hypothetical protein Ae706Ps2_6569 [Pseudonocardia sp. Ae706_Ps2]